MKWYVVVDFDDLLTQLCDNLAYLVQIIFFHYR